MWDEDKSHKRTDVVTIAGDGWQTEEQWRKRTVT